MEFRERLQKASERGRQARAAKLSEAAAKALSEEECRRLHSNYRLTLMESIEKYLHDLADNFPGFRLEAIIDETGWGSVAKRDDITISNGRRENAFSRLRIVVSPYNEYHVLEIVAKGTVRNKEAFIRNHYQRLEDADMESFHELVELWVLDYAEMYAAAG
jgi:hypothetical protein